MVASNKALRKLKESIVIGDDDSSSSSSDSVVKADSSTTTNNTPGASQQHTNSSESSSLAKSETRAVNRSKLLVLLILCMAAVGVGIATYIFARDTETKEFESKFHDFSIEMEELVHGEARNVFRTVSNFATTLTSEALSRKMTWPFVSIPHFEVRGTELNELSNSLMIAFSPVVQEKDRDAWGRYSAYMKGWIKEGLEQRAQHESVYWDKDWEFEGKEDMLHFAPFIHGHLGSARDDPDATAILETDPGPYLPVWQQAPVPLDPGIINYNLFNHPNFSRVFRGMNETLSPVLSEATDLEFFYGGSIHDEVDHPHSFLMQPIFQDFNDSVRDHTHIVGVVIAILPWDHYFENILPREAQGIVVRMEDTCGDRFSYQINGPEATYLGKGDYTDEKYRHLEEWSRFAPFQKLNYSNAREHCEYDIHITPSYELEQNYRTNKPVLYAVLVVMVFLVTTMVFVIYDVLVTRRQNKVMLAAKKSNAVVASLFPRKIRERMLQEAEEQILANEKNGNRTKLRLGAMPKSELKNFLDNGIANADGVAFDTKPIADLFPSTTIMFADIAGFTAWSSVREPSQVFTLLETLYHAFDEIAKRRRVFKVETIGDCYVAVCGLPEPRKDHASVMARFSRDIITAMNDLTKKLEVSLGPDTGDLSVRVGLHSGPVTAGVLRGDKSRFQLFGDTVNTAARMESNGVRNRIHISKETADLLKESGKSHWVVPRKEKISAKGKGYLETFFLDIKKQSSGSQTSGKSGASGSSEGSVKLDLPHLESLCNRAGAEMQVDAAVPAQLKRRIEWNTDVLLRMLKHIVSRRNAERKHAMDSSHKSSSQSVDGEESAMSELKHRTVLDEVKEVIMLPEFNAEAAMNEEDPAKVELPPVVVKQLREYVTVVASLYHHDNPFHNFEHASHVTMSVVKLLSRIVAPEDVLKATDDVVDKELHDHTYGITSDPLTQFAVAFSALIHDVDHEGVPNTQLIEEKFDIARIYRNQSIAEQNSVDLAWSLLMEDNFKELRKAIYSTEDERRRFRQLVVNVVLATDICDAELKKLRNGRWAKAFSGVKPENEEEAREDVNRKATIVLEHLIQASDVAHTMQHWHIYRKWNELFFQENMKAYRAGRSNKDPSEYWYEGEIGFFDYYIIPLAKKLKDCGVFGVSSDEYLNYAISNRKEWAVQGKEVVAQMSAKYLPPLTEAEEEEEDEDERHSTSEQPEPAHVSLHDSYHSVSMGDVEDEDRKGDNLV